MHDGRHASQVFSAVFRTLQPLLVLEGGRGTQAMEYFAALEQQLEPDVLILSAAIGAYRLALSCFCSLVFL